MRAHDAIIKALKKLILFVFVLQILLCCNTLCVLGEIKFFFNVLFLVKICCSRSDMTVVKRRKRSWEIIGRWVGFSFKACYMLEAF